MGYLMGTAKQSEFLRIYNYAQAVKQNLRSEPIFFTDFEKKPTVFQSKTNVSIFRIISFYA